jgi:hypothetical protein
LPSSPSRPSTYCTASQSCKDLSSDPKNCGSCSAACPRGVPCRSGRCQAACQSPNTFCPGGVSCVNLQGNVNHCGRCGSKCPAAGTLSSVASVSCTSGACALTCNAGFRDCDANATTGCEVSVDDCSIPSTTKLFLAFSASFDTAFTATYIFPVRTGSL